MQVCYVLLHDDTKTTRGDGAITAGFTMHWALVLGSDFVQQVVIATGVLLCERQVAGPS